METTLKVKLLAENAMLPKKANNTDIGYDLYVSKVERISQSCIFKIRFGIAVEVEIFRGPGVTIEVKHFRNIHLELVARSSIYKYGLYMVNSVGIIDPGYRGEICMIVAAIDPDNYRLPEEKERFGQLILRQSVDVDKVVSFEKLTQTDRGEGGFGSSGTE